MSRYFYSLGLIFLLQLVFSAPSSAKPNPVPIAGHFMDAQSDANVILTPSYGESYRFDLLMNSQGYDAFVKPDSYYVLPGGTVSFNGIGFSPNEDVSVLKNGHILDVITADDKGNIKTPAYKAGYAIGLDNYVFRGNEGSDSFKVDVKVENVKPWLTLDSYYKPYGGNVSVSGHFFGAAEPILVSFNGESVLRANTDARGEFKVSGAVPAGTGKVSIKAYSLKTGKMAATVLSK